MDPDSSRPRGVTQGAHRLHEASRKQRGRREEEVERGPGKRRGADMTWQAARRAPVEVAVAGSWGFTGSVGPGPGVEARWGRTLARQTEQPMILKAGVGHPHRPLHCPRP